MPPRTRVGSRPPRIGIFVALAIVVVDQAAKAFVLLVVMSPPRVIPVTPFFNLTLGFNTGVSFGLFSSDSQLGPWVLSAIAVIVVLVLIGLLYRSRHMGETAGLGAMIGGALGNVTDRIRQGAITDFLDFYVGNWHWPTFNLVDTAITIGAAVLIVPSLFARSRPPVG